MIALGIATTWITLTAAGFAGLSAFDRSESRKYVESELATPERSPISDRSSYDQSLVLADTRSLIARALLG